MVLPVKHDRGLSDHESQVQLSVDLAEAVVRSSTEHQVVLGALLLSVAAVVSLGVEVARVVVYLGVMESHESGGNQHGAYED